MASIDVESLCLDKPQTLRVPPSPPQTQKAPKEPKIKAPKIKAPKEPKAPQTQRASSGPFVIYLGVGFDLSVWHPILELDTVVALFEKYPELKRKDTVHITLRFFQKKCEDKGAIVDEFMRFIEEHGAEVSITVTGIGYHEGTCALQVSPVILTMDGHNTLVPWTHDKQNHITIALEEGKSAKNSIFAVMKQEGSSDYPGDFTSFEPSVVITGSLRPFSS